MNIPSDEDFEKTIDTMFTNLADNEKFLEALELDDNGSFLGRLEVSSVANEAWVDAAMQTIRDMHPQDPVPDNVMNALETLFFLSISMDGYSLIKVNPERLREKRQQSE